MPAEYEVLAIRYGTVNTTRANLLYRYHAYGENDTPIQMDYYFWVIRNDTETILLDTGFFPAAGTRRGRNCLVDPVVALEQIGIGADDVSRIIVSHFHYDHIGNIAAFPRATVSAQAKELDFWLSPIAKRFQFASTSEQNELDHLDASAREGRLTTIDGNAELAPGITARLVGGHCPGQQIITVSTQSGPVVLASDALHLYEELELDRPFEVFSDLPATYATYDTLAQLVSDGASLVAGHDPDVMRRYPALSPETSELAVRIG